MDDTDGFATLARAMRFSSEYEKAKAERAASETLIASAEYELAQLKELFEGARLDRPPARPAEDAPAAFAGKVRKPEEAPGDAAALRKIA